VTIRGWLYNIRESGKLVFPIFRDGTGIIQGVCSLKENPEAFEALKGLTQESSVIATGNIRAEQARSRRLRDGRHQDSDRPARFRGHALPIQLKEHGVDFCSTNAISGFARLGRPQFSASAPRPSLRARIYGLAGLHAYRPPMFTPAACEKGTSTLFE